MSRSTPPPALCTPPTPPPASSRSSARARPARRASTRSQTPSESARLIDARIDPDGARPRYTTRPTNTPAGTCRAEPCACTIRAAPQVPPAGADEGFGDQPVSTVRARLRPSHPATTTVTCVTATNPDGDATRPEGTSDPTGNRRTPPISVSGNSSHRRPRTAPRRTAAREGGAHPGRRRRQRAHLRRPTAPSASGRQPQLRSHPGSSPPAHPTAGSPRTSSPPTERGSAALSSASPPSTRRSRPTSRSRLLQPFTCGGFALAEPPLTPPRNRSRRTRKTRSTCAPTRRSERRTRTRRSTTPQANPPTTGLALPAPTGYVEHSAPRRTAGERLPRDRPSTHHKRPCSTPFRNRSSPPPQTSPMSSSRSPAHRRTAAAPAENLYEWSAGRYSSSASPNHRRQPRRRSSSSVPATNALRPRPAISADGTRIFFGRPNGHLYCATPPRSDAPAPRTRGETAKKRRPVPGPRAPTAPRVLHRPAAPARRRRRQAGRPDLYACRNQPKTRQRRLRVTPRTHPAPHGEAPTCRASCSARRGRQRRLLRRRRRALGPRARPRTPPLRPSEAGKPRRATCNLYVELTAPRPNLANGNHVVAASRRGPAGLARPATAPRATSAESPPMSPPTAATSRSCPSSR